MRSLRPGRKNIFGEDADLDRLIDSAIHHIMIQPPPTRVYEAIRQRVRRSSKSRPNLRTSLVCAFGFAAALFFVMIAAGLFRHGQVEAALPGDSFLLFTRLGNTGLATWINESESIFGYPGILFLHTLGLALVVGFSFSADMRLLGVAPRIPIVSLSRLYPYIWLGFWINAASGVLLFVADPIHKAMNPLFEIKLALVAVGVAVMALVQRQLHRIESQPETEKLERMKSQLLASTSLIIWFSAITAGRLLAYFKAQ